MGQESHRRRKGLGLFPGQNRTGLQRGRQGQKALDNAKHAVRDGGTILWNTEKNLGLLAEINFSQQGWKESFPDDPQYHYERRTNYVEIPFLTHIYFGGKHVKAFINLGPKIGFFLNESTSENLNGAKPNSTNIQHYLYVEKYIDWGLCGGPGIEFRTPIGNFQLEGRYYYALGNIYNSRKQDPFSKSAYQIMSAKITYLFRIK